jgi:hypothetical protein
MMIYLADLLHGRRQVWIREFAYFYSRAARPSHGPACLLGRLSNVRYRTHDCVISYPDG